MLEPDQKEPGVECRQQKMKNDGSLPLVGAATMNDDHKSQR